MGCVGSKSSEGLSKEAVVSAAVVPQNGSAPVAITSGIKAAAALTTGAKAVAAVSLHAEPVMLFDTRVFDVERERENTVKSLGVIDTPIDDPRFNAITKLMASIFQTPVALITLITEDRVWFKSKVGPFGACVTREGSWCNYISVPNAPEVLITEDASEDARFAANPYVAGDPHIKFYAGAPLVGSGGMRYGTLCVVDLKRRSFSAEMYALLCNFANLVVRELERDTAALVEAHEEAAAVAAGQQRIADLMDATASGVALVDVRSRSWPVLYANAAFAMAEGSNSVPDCTSAGFWDQFEPVEGADAKGGMMTEVDAAVAEGRPTRAIVRSRCSGRRATVVLRPGSSDQMVPHKAIGIPNWVPSEKATQAGCHAGVLPGGLDDGGDAFEGPMGTESAPQPQLANCFWFVTVEELEGADGAATAGTPLGSAGSVASSAPCAPGTPVGGDAAKPAKSKASAGSLQTFSSQPLPELLVGLEMGPLVGSGSFGRVYRGMWRDEVVAVKLIDCTFSSSGSSESAVEGAIHEAELSKGLDHPSIVKTYEYALLGPQEGGREGGTLWMVQQMCNHGTLIEAADRGWMRKKRSLVAPPDMAAVLATLREVASGMAFLHSKDILHCDLTGNNVLLEACEPEVSGGRGFRARVGDFGLARVSRGQVTTATFGTCSHMSPELMSDGLLTPAADVWSFGVLCWELYCGVRAYVGHRMPHIIFLVTSGKGALKLPEGVPNGFNAMVQSCLERDHTKRPSFAELVATLDKLIEEGEEATLAPPAPDVGGGPCKGAADLAAAAKAINTPAVQTPVLRD